MGVDARGVPGGLLRFDPAFAYVEPPSSWPLSWAEYLTLAPNTRQHIKKQRHHFADKGLYSQSYGFSSSQEYGRAS